MVDLWDQMVDCICRPPRDNYCVEQLLGSPAGTSFYIGPVQVRRTDFELTNNRGAKLQCSHYAPVRTERGLLTGKDGKLPVVVYCHCNSGSRRDAEEAVGHLLPMGIGVVAFDFMGSGLSDGQWVTLGYNEADDLGVVVEWLRERHDISSIGLWGRSMGAVTALMYSSRDPGVAGMVLDSPFSRLTDLMGEIVKDTGLPIPKPLFKMVTSLMRRSVKKKAGFDIKDVSPLDVVPGSVIPAVFGHATGDSFIRVSHSEKLAAAYGGEYKNLVRFEGDHNHLRPRFFYDSVTMFFHQQFRMDEQLPGHTEFLMDYNEVAAFGGGAAGGAGGGGGGLGALASYPSQDLGRANGLVSQPWRISLTTEDDLGQLSEDEFAHLLGANGTAGATGAGPGPDAGLSPAAAPAAAAAVGGAAAPATASGGAGLDPATQLQAVLGGAGGAGGAAAAAQQRRQQQQQQPQPQPRWYDDDEQLRQAMLLSLQEAGGPSGGSESPPALQPVTSSGRAGASAGAGLGAAGAPAGTTSGAQGQPQEAGEQQQKAKRAGAGLAARAKALFSGSSRPRDGTPSRGAGGALCSSGALAAGAGAGAGAGSGEAAAAAPGWRQMAPSTAEEAEELLQKALALSLQEPNTPAVLAEPPPAAASLPMAQELPEAEAPVAPAAAGAAAAPAAAGAQGAAPVAAPEAAEHGAPAPAAEAEAKAETAPAASGLAVQGAFKAGLDAEAPQKSKAAGQMAEADYEAEAEAEAANLGVVAEVAALGGDATGAKRSATASHAAAAPQQCVAPHLQ